MILLGLGYSGTLQGIQYLVDVNLMSQARNVLLYTLILQFGVGLLMIDLYFYLVRSWQIIQIIGAAFSGIAIIMSFVVFTDNPTLQYNEGQYMKCKMTIDQIKRFNGDASRLIYRIKGESSMNYDSDEE